MKEKVLACLQELRNAQPDDIIKIFYSLCDIISGDADNEIKKDVQLLKLVFSILTDMEKAVQDKRHKHYIKSFMYVYGEDRAAYFSELKAYIVQHKRNNKFFSYEDAYMDILRFIFFIKDDDVYKSYIRSLLSILTKHIPESAFCAYVKYLTKTYVNTNSNIKALQQILEIDKNWYVTYIDLGKIYYNEKKWQEAIYCYESAISSGNLWKVAWVYFSLAWCYNKTKDYIKSVENYKKGLELNPTARYRNYDLAYVYKKMKDYDNALNYIDKSIEFDGIHYYNFNLKLEILVAAKMYNSAILLANEHTMYTKSKNALRLLEKVGGEKLEQTVENKNAGIVEIRQANSGLQLYSHQQDAIRDMSRKILDKEKYSGLLVLPTGGGKTLTATYWLMGNILDQGQRVIWLAHRHELLNQAHLGFERVSFSDIARRKRQYNFRIISGQHDKPVHIQSSDDIIIAGKTSLHRGFSHLMEKWLSGNNNDVFLVIDEAHHATAKEYRELINKIREAVPSVKILGLTATPFRTADNEQGLLKKIFYDDIAYKIDLRELINRGILAEPIFEEVETEVDMIKLFQTSDGSEVLARIEKDSFFDIDSIGSVIATDIAENAERNNIIVRKYIENKEKYGQTLVFALNITMAIALNKVFKDYGVKSDFVVSGVRDMITGASQKDNPEKIQKFRDGELNVLINVNILTEGTDLPKVQTVFLTRPTKSTILMTQMIGRALRGLKAGGTKDCYIVSFVDDWQSRIAWINPERLFIDENADFNDLSTETRKMAIRLIAIKKIEEFAAIANGTLDERLEKINFIERIPIGLYKFSYLMPTEDDEDEAINCDVLVFDCMQKAYRELFDWLPTADLQDVDAAARHINDTLFTETDRLIGYNKKDITDIIHYYKQNEELPEFIAFIERSDYDISRLAEHIVDNDLGERGRKNYISDQWNRSESHWMAFFGVDNQLAFLNLIDSEIKRISYPELYKKPEQKPLTQYEQRQIQDLPLYEIRQRFPELGEKIRSAVFEKYTGSDGYYFSAESGYKSRRKLDFQIDHIIPMWEDGKTVLDNLQLLKRVENANKGDKLL